jgi:hypothetical protein
MKSVLKILFGAILVSMLCVTTIATIDRGMLDAGGELWKFWWFRATLADAYCGFITFFAWVAFKERRWLRKSLWFVLIMALGNIAMSIYVLIELFRLKRDEPLANLLTRQNA